jgi:hypothetical protein
MSSQQKELFRLAVLRVFSANKTRFGLGPEAICHLVAVFGFPSPGLEPTADAIDYLARKQFLEEVGKPISPENRVWRITSTGIGFLDERD